MSGEPHDAERRRYIGLVLGGGIVLATLTAPGNWFSLGAGQGVSDWLIAHLFPNDEPAERELLASIVARQLADDSILAGLDAALRAGITADPFDRDALNRSDESLAAVLREYLRESAYFRRALGLPDDFALDADCGLAPAPQNEPQPAPKQ